MVRSADQARRGAGSASDESLYQRILAIATEYMGPAAEDYIRRRIRIVQRGEDPERITPDKIERLAAGIEMTAKMYLPANKAEEFRRQILSLGPSAISR